MWYIVNSYDRYVNHRNLPSMLNRDVDTLDNKNYIELIIRGLKQSFRIRKATTLYGLWIMRDGERLYIKLTDLNKIVKDYKIFEWVRVLDNDIEDGPIEECPYLQDMK